MDKHDTDKTETASVLRPAAGSKIRKSSEEKRNTCLAVREMVANWICDGCPYGGDSADHPTSEDEAYKLLRLLDQRANRFTSLNNN